MKPYYDHDGVTIYHGDCREIVPMLAVNSGDAGHEWAQHEREGWTVCSRCGLVRNYDRESPCRRVMPEIEPRDGGAS